jgi:hypothetical protein
MRKKGQPAQRQKLFRGIAPHAVPPPGGRHQGNDSISHA